LTPDPVIHNQNVLISNTKRLVYLNVASKTMSGIQIHIICFTYDKYSELQYVVNIEQLRYKSKNGWNESLTVKSFVGRIPARNRVT
jgi:hypothetical protein